VKEDLAAHQSCQIPDFCKKAKIMKDRILGKTLFHKKRIVLMSLRAVRSMNPQSFARRTR